VPRGSTRITSGRPHVVVVSTDLIIFDCDGVLVDSEPIINRVFVQMLAECGHLLDYDLTGREFSGATMADRLATTRQRLHWTPPPDFKAHFDRRLLDALERELRPVPGVLPVLDSLECRWCVASNGSHDDMRTRLGLAGLLERFNPRLFSASEVTHAKPAPDLFLYAAAVMDAAPDQCAVVEDSVRGVQAGVSAGMTVLGFARLTSPDILREAGAIVFEDMRLLPDLLKHSGRKDPLL
jgi:HAD superfamily hydrolase (TIGR01509 family)